MRYFIFLAIPVFLFAASYRTILQKVDTSLKLKSAKEMQQAAYKLYQSAQGKNYPTLEASLSAFKLRQTPTLTFYPPGVPPQTVIMGTKENYRGALSLQYPLFTGFALSASIDEAKLKNEKAKLQVLDLRRNLYLNITRLATSVAATKESLKALQKAKTATTKALQKAQGFFQNGLIPPSELYNIQAKSYQIDAGISELRARKQQLLNTLSYLLSSPIDSVELPALPTMKLDKEALLKKALNQRADILALQKTLGIERTHTQLAKSSLYPTLALAAELKRQGDTLALDGNGYTNADQSYVGAQVRWNLFNGFSDKNRIEASKLKELSLQTQLNDYKEKVRQEIENAFLQLHTLQAKLKSAQMETKAKEEYYKLTFGRFKNQLASADELSRSIADLASTKAKTATLKAQIFNQYQTILLLGDSELFAKINALDVSSPR